MNPKTARLTTLFGTASFLTLATSLDAQAQQVAQGQMAQAQASATQSAVAFCHIYKGLSNILTSIWQS